MEEYKRVSFWLFWIVVLVLVTVSIRSGMEGFVSTAIWLTAILGAPIAGLNVADYLYKRRMNPWIIGVSAFAVFGLVSITVFQMGAVVKETDWVMQYTKPTNANFEEIE